MIETRLFIDWLSATVPGDSRGLAGAIETANSVMPELSDTWAVSNPFNGYQAAAKGAFGVIVLAGGERMGTHLQFTGATLSALPDAPASTFTLLGALMNLSSKFPRLDIALDAINSKLDIKRLRVMFERGDAETRVKTFHIEESNGGGITLYLGAPKSDAQMRIYNKAAERRSKAITPPAEDWIRVELQLRDRLANDAARMVARPGQAERAMRSIMLGFVDFPSYAVWTSIFRGPVIGIGKSTKARSNVRKWLLGPVAASLARELVSDPAFKDEFERSVRSWIESAKPISQDT